MNDLLYDARAWRGEEVSRRVYVGSHGATCARSVRRQTARDGPVVVRTLASCIVAYSRIKVTTCSDQAAGPQSLHVVISGATTCSGKLLHVVTGL